MLIVLKRILLAIIGGTLFQVLIYALFSLFGIAGLSIVFLWSWLLFGGDEPHQTWARYVTEWVIVIAVNNLIYSSLIYCVLWNRHVTKDLRNSSFI